MTESVKNDKFGKILCPVKCLHRKLGKVIRFLLMSIFLRWVVQPPTIRWTSYDGEKKDTFQADLGLGNPPEND